ncbi:hypothetical protein ACI6Q2_01215 [Chitinophagaceae bacterium LWZ2-11]
MKSRVLNLCLAVCLLLAVNITHGQNLDNPGAYMSAVSNAQTEMNQKYMAYSSAVAHGRRAKKIEKMRQQTLESINNARYKTIDLPIYKGDNSLRQAGTEYIQFCYNVFNEDYKRIVNMEEIAEQSFDGMQAYILLQEKTGEKLKEASDKMNNACKTFAAKYNVNLVDSKDALSEKMEVAAKLNHYTNQVYLVFFKCNWEYNQVIDAMNKKKVNDIEQARNAVIKYADDGLAQLTADSLKSFQNDPSLAVACKQALQYYKKAAENEIPKLTDFYLKEEAFTKLKKTMDSKPDRTQADVDTYNKGVKDYNASVQAFNQINTNLNNGGNQASQNWQNTEKAFADTHMPYYK